MKNLLLDDFVHMLYAVLRVQRVPPRASIPSTRKENPKTLSHSGGYNGEATPVPIPNTAVKLSRVDNTWLVTARKDRSLPDYIPQ